MATPKGAQISKAVSTVLVLKAVQPNGEEQVMAEADADDELQKAWLDGLAKSFKEGGIQHALIERTTTVRTQIVDKVLTT